MIAIYVIFFIWIRMETMNQIPCSGQRTLAFIMMMFPNYADREKRWEITDEMKQQGVLEESSGQWFFKITDEQFEELARPYMEALELARERRREEMYTYEELFGEYETE